MSHERWENLLLDDVYGELAPGDREALAAHLASCAACREEREALARTLSLTRAMPPGPEPEGDLSALLAAAGAEAARLRGSREGPWERFVAAVGRLALRPAAVAAGLVAVTTAGMAWLLVERPGAGDGQLDAWPPAPRAVEVRADAGAAPPAFALLGTGGEQPAPPPAVDRDGVRAGLDPASRASGNAAGGPMGADGAPRASAVASSAPKSSGLARAPAAGTGSPAPRVQAPPIPADGAGPLGSADRRALAAGVGARSESDEAPRVPPVDGGHRGFHGAARVPAPAGRASPPAETSLPGSASAASGGGGTAADHAREAMAGSRSRTATPEPPASPTPEAAREAAVAVAPRAAPTAPAEGVLASRKEAAPAAKSNPVREAGKAPAAIARTERAPAPPALADAVREEEEPRKPARRAIAIAERSADDEVVAESEGFPAESRRAEPLPAPVAARKAAPAGREAGPAIAAHAAAAAAAGEEAAEADRLFAAAERARSADRFDEAISIYLRLADGHPAHPRAPDALLAAARLRKAGGDLAGARRLVARLESSYAGTAAAADARRLLPDAP